MITYPTTKPVQGDNEEVLFRKLVQLLGGEVSPTDGTYDSLRKAVTIISAAKADADNGVSIGDTEYVLARKLLILVGTVS